MRAWKRYAAAVLGLLFLASTGLPGTDVARLEPVEVVQIRREAGKTTVQTDTGQMGRGKDLEAALLDMKNTASREVFLETAIWLLLDPAAGSDLATLEKLLRPNCRLCLYRGAGDLKEKAEFLEQQRLTFLLRDWRRGKIPILYEKEGRSYLEQGK